MKKKLSRIVGVAVSIALVASLCAFAIPVATPAEAASQSWSPQTLPTAVGNVLLSGSNVTDYAVANDGLTIYVANNGVAANAAGAVLISTNGGQSFTALTVTTAGANVMSAIAVAPDDPTVVTVVEFLTTACVVHISVNSGSTWTALPVAYAATTPSAVVGVSDITDIDVGPARSGCVFGREYVVSFADPTTATVAGADVQIIGRLATWSSVSAANVGSPTDPNTKLDYMAVKFSPSFVGDRVVALVGANTSGGVYFQLINTNTNAEVRTPVLMTPAGVAASTIDYQLAGAAANSIIAADIALPSDFDPNVVSMREAFASYGSVTPFTDNDVYRIDDSSVRALGAVNLLAIKSVAYTGVIDDGALFMGEYASNNVKYALDPWVSLPYWKSTRKGPSPDATISANAMPIVRVSPTDSNVVFAGTSSAANLESAFSVSNNKAISFDAISLIDSAAANTVVTVDDIYLTPDGGTMFMATSDTGGAQLSLWKSATPTGTISWSRVYVTNRTGPGLIRLNPDWDTTPTIYFAQRSATGAIYVSTDGGDVFNTGRTAPAAITATDIAVENSNTVYLGSGTNVYKSTNSAAIWETPINAQAAVIQTLAMAPSYPNIPVEGNLLVGGTAAVSYSTNGGTSFVPINVGLAGTGLIQVLADEDYATEGAAGENTIYCADSSGGTFNTFRFVIGTSAVWDNLVTTMAANNVSGLAMANGVFYSLNSAALGPYRTLYSTIAVGLIPWEAMGAGAIAGTLAQVPSALRVTGGSNILYAINTTGNTVLTYTDMVATDVPTLAGPADGTTVDIDPVAGRANDVQFSWSSMESGTGLVNGYEIWIAVAGTDFAAPLTLVYDAVAGTTVGTSTGGLNASNPQLIVGPTGQWVQALMANTDYEWKIRARNSVSADAIRSGWSEVRSFSVQAGGAVQQPYAGPILQGPTGGAVNVALSPGFSWSPVSGATEYEFILATDAGLTNTIADTPVTLTTPAFQVTTPLEYGTVYFWAVRSTAPTVSPQGIGSFTTMEEPAAAVYTCMQCGLQFESQEALEAHIAATHAPVTPATPAYVWAIITIGAVLVIVVIVLITRTRRVA